MWPRIFVVLILIPLQENKTKKVSALIFSYNNQAAWLVITSMENLYFCMVVSRVLKSKIQALYRKILHSPNSSELYMSPSQILSRRGEMFHHIRCSEKTGDDNKDALSDDVTFQRMRRTTERWSDPVKSIGDGLLPHQNPRYHSREVYAEK